MNNEFIELLMDGIVDPNLSLPDPTLIQYYKDLKNRIVWINDKIDVDSLDLVSRIVEWNREDKDKSIKDRQPIKLYFYSPGGDLDVEETLVSMIKLSKTPIYGYALGMVASAASLIYLSCHKRFALPNAYFIFHRGSCENVGGSYNEVIAAMEDYRVQVEKMEKYYIEHTTYPEEVVKRNIQTDWYIHLDEALKYNVVTDLIQTIDVLL